MRRDSQGKYKTFSLILYPEGSKRVYVEGRYLPEIAKQLQGKSALLTVGAGRINVMVSVHIYEQLNSLSSDEVERELSRQHIDDEEDRKS
ncbi:MAG: hypothetical protein DRQ24_03570 [Candidatus Latescibacterota bacterium]|nr:MAG: hypothetical protein DRQ24_03570 [Candidatus Latescibacterota bacterium]